MAAAILYIFLWASAFVPSRVISRAAPPLTILSIRFLIAGVLLLGGALLAKLPMPRGRAVWLRLCLLGATGNALYLGLTHLALKHLTAGMGSIVASTNPLLLALVAPRLLGEPLTRKKLLGLVLGFSGVLLAMHARTGTKTAEPRDVLLAFAGVIALVTQTVLYKRMRERPHPIVLNGAQLFCAGVLLIPAALLLEPHASVQWTLPVIYSLTYLIAVLSLGASMLWFWILRHGEASRVSAFYFLTPIFGLLLGALLLGEQVLPQDAAGLLVIGAGLWLVARG